MFAGIYGAVFRVVVCSREWNKRIGSSFRIPHSASRTRIVCPFVQTMIDQASAIEQQALADIARAGDLETLDEVRVRYLGKNGRLTELLRGIGQAAPDDRPRIGQRVNQAKSAISGAIETRRNQLQASTRAVKTALDRSLPGRAPHMGHRHPLTWIREEVTEIFRGMGFSVADGPEVELDYYNFEALNIPADHPARDTQDTFYFSGDVVLRTHTSPVQIRVMETQRPPVRVIAPGRCYRHENPDATHAFTFHQCEGLYVDKDVTMANLKGDLTHFARQMFGRRVQVRFRPDFFPFTEPSVDYAFSCVACGGTNPSCAICKGSGWLEISGAGMVDPNVFGFVDYDAERYTGYAFGMGLERLAMLKYGIENISLFLENDLRFLQQR